MTNQNVAISKTVEGAKDEGIKVVFEKVDNKVKMSFYIDNPDKFNENYFYANEEDKAVPFEIKKDDFIGQATVDSHSDYLKVADRYLSILPGIEESDDYIDEDDYYSRFTDEGDPKPILLCDRLASYFLIRLNGYKGEFWQFIHPDVDQFYLFQ